jgi:hypothetical protein
MRATTRLGAVALVLLLGSVAVASAQIVSVCEDAPAAVRKGGWVLDVTYHPSGPTAANNLRQLTLASYMFTRGNGTLVAAAHGTAHIQDGTSNTILLAERIVRLACADADGDGRAGIAAVDISMRNLRTDEEVLLLIIAVDGELNSRNEEVILVIGRETVVGRVNVHEFVFSVELPPV